MRVKAVLGGLLALTLAALPGAAAADPDDGAQAQAPVYAADEANTIPGQYIVVFHAGLRAESEHAAEQVAREHGAQIRHRYHAAIDGFAGSLSDQAVERLRRNPNVAYIEADAEVHAVADQPNPPSWGIDRIDQRNRPVDNNYHYDATGAGVKAYIIDTGIRFSHTDFGGRAVTGFDAIDGGSADDCNGHGTHVAGTVGGNAHGVAKQVQLVGVRVLNCSGSGSNSQVIAGIDWVTGNHTAGQPASANMSLGGGASTALDNAVRNSIADGVTYALAAGNDNANACNGSPGRTAEAITVGSTTSTDARSSFSNFGTCVDIFAPGSSITSAWSTSDTATNTISGTSMATPHVAGVAALYLHANPSATPQHVRDAIVNNGTTGVVTNPGTGSPNVLLYSLFGGTPPPPPPPPPPPAPPPPPPPPPPPSGCSSLGQVFTGSLAGTDDVDYFPSSSGFSAAAGIHRGCLDGPSGVDFDIYLQKRWLFGWYDVAEGVGLTADEDVTYTGTSGTYRWQVHSYSGSGSYTFGLNRP